MKDPVGTRFAFVAQCAIFREVTTLATQPRFVRHRDRGAWDLRGKMKVNPRAGNASTRAGLTWIGEREYETPDGPLRVLRRPGQVESAGHLRSLRRMSTPAGHPSGDRDVTPANHDELSCGFTGDKITIESVGVWRRPCADLTITRAACFAQMMDAAEWAEYARMYPSYAAGVTRPPGPAKTGTSLGYNALWLSPFVESEIVSDAGGKLVGAWVGPDGKTYEYDVEHVIDPDCEIVKRLERDSGFDPLSLGGQHFAVRLDALTGRGEEQSELMRVVDSKLIGSDPMRGRVQFQVPRATRVSDVKWTVAASRDLPLEEGTKAWDGAAAAASIFDGAGWPDSPDPAAAKLGFLFFDADAPEVKGSYKDPIARRGEDGKLRVPKSGIDAAASAIPKTDVPEEVQARGRAVVEHYQDKFERAQPSSARDTGASNMTTANPKQTVAIGVRDRKILDYCAAKGITLPVMTNLTLDEVDAAKLQPLIDAIMGNMAELVEALKMAETDAAKAGAKVEGLEEKMVDMPSVEEAQAKLKAAQEELAAAQAAAAEQKKASDEEIEAEKTKVTDLAAKVATLDAELIPVRAAQLAEFKTQIVSYGLDAATAEKCTDEAAVRRAFVVATVDASQAEAKQSDIDLLFIGAAAGAKRTADAAAALAAKDEGKKPAAAKPPEYTPGPGLHALPPVTTHDDGKKSEPGTPPKPLTRGEELAIANL